MYNYINENNKYIEYEENELDLRTCDIKFPPGTYPSDSKKPITFCCNINVPNNFKIDWKNTRFVYDINCLNIFVKQQIICCDTNCGPVNIPVFTVVVAGCIPYLLSMDVCAPCGGLIISDGDCNVHTDTKREASICCKGSICVDQIIDCSTTLPTLPVLTCDNVKLIKFGQIENPNGQIKGIDGKDCDIDIKCQDITIVGEMAINIPKTSYPPCPPTIPSTSPTPIPPCP